MSDKYKIIQCEECVGIGLIKKNDQPACECGLFYTGGCYKCENIQFRGQYTECPECLGIGSHWVNKITQKKTLVWCLANP
jgi:hypothetical protein